MTVEPRWATRFPAVHTPQLAAVQGSRRGACGTPEPYWAAIVLLGACVTVAYLMSPTPFALVSWLSAYVLLIAACLLTEQGKAGLRALLVASLAYTLLSGVGMVVASDNLRNFGTLFGRGGDDSRYFDRSYQLAMVGVLDADVGLYELTLSVWIRAVALVRGQELWLLDVLPFNWAVGAAVVSLLDRMCLVLSGSRPPIVLLLCASLGNFSITDSLIHLYRDGLIYCLFLSGLLAAHRARWSQVLWLGLGVAALRGGSFMLYSLYVVAGAARKRLRSREVFFISSGLAALVLAAVMQGAGLGLFQYASSLGRELTLDRRFDFAGNVEHRSQFIADQVTSESTLAASLQGGGIAAKATRPIVFAFFPMRFWSLEWSGKSHSHYARATYVRAGTAYYHVFGWLAVASWILVIPLAGVGAYESLRGTESQNVILVYYLAALLGVAFVSMQMRHGVAFSIMNAPLAAIGWRAVQMSRSHRVIAVAIGGMVSVGVAFYNHGTGALI